MRVPVYAGGPSSLSPAGERGNSVCGGRSSFRMTKYFVGPSIGIKGFFIQGGAHIGRRQELTNGFAIDDVIPDKYPGVPLTRAWHAKFGLAVTYRIPLPK